MKKTDKETTLSELKESVLKFIQERDWNKFHTGKNLSMSIAIEAAELMEHFQWTDGKKKISREVMGKIRHEIADVVIYALDFCNMLDIDLSQAIWDKIKHNEKKYPASKVKGKSHKYTYYKEKSRKRASRPRQRLKK